MKPTTPTLPLGNSNRMSMLATMPADATIRNLLEEYLSEAQPPTSWPPTPIIRSSEFVKAAICPV